jgi:hypothetical protein
MGKAITYCVQCSKRVSETDLETGKAFRIGDRILCRACTPDPIKSQTTKKVQRPRESGTTVNLKTSTPPPTAPPNVPDDVRKRKVTLIATGVAGAVVLILVIFLLLRSHPAPVTALPPDNPAPPPGTPTAPVDPKLTTAQADLEQARKFAKEHPEDLAGRRKQFDDLKWKYEGTEVAAEAAKEEAAVKALILEKVAAWMLEAEAQIKPFLDKGELRAAARKLEELKPQHQLPQWNLAVEKRVRELYEASSKAEDLGKDKKPETEKPVDPVPPKPGDKALTEESKAYPAKWEVAAAKATARDYAGAAAEVARLVAGAKDEDVRREAEQDLADFKALGALWKSGLDALKKKPRGAGLGLLARTPSGETKSVGGRILQIDAERVELQASKGSAWVEWADVATSTVAEQARDSKTEPRLLAALCLVDGESEAATSFQEDPGAKWWAYGSRARGQLPKPDPAEKGARDLYYAAEKNWRSMETRAAAIDAYKSLKIDFASTSLVRAYSERIARRAEAGKEYYFTPADFLAEGTFRLAKSGKLESVKDSDDVDTLRNSAEIEFAALAGVTYRCWVWVGACCEETFLFYLQGTEVTDTDPKTRKKIACEVGTNFASPLKPPLRGLKKTHAEHKPKGAKEHPKTAARWEWVEIPLPKYAAPGGKKLRLMTNQAGFSIGGAVVSSSRKAAPAEAELKDLEKDRDVPEALPIDADLVAWWGFEEGSGNTVADLTGKGHDAKVVGNVQWVDGKIGGGIRFPGPGPTLRVEHRDDLNLPGDLTLALWMKKDGDAGEWSCLVGKGEKQQRNYCLWIETKTSNILFQQYGAAAVNQKSKASVRDGVWTHVAATVEGNKATIYINGVKDIEVEHKGPASVVPFPVGMGYACEHGTYRGALDDVRIYRRALSAEEIKTLVEQSR